MFEGFPLLLLTLSLLSNSVHCLRAEHSSFNIQRLPPNIIKNKGDGRGGENGYRQLTPSECDSLCKNWCRKIGLLDNVHKMELYEMLNVIEDCSRVMPGNKPQRKELLAIGELQDGQIHCISMGYLVKVTCPWELQVLALAQLQIDHSTELMVQYLRDLCIEHACVPDYSYLHRWSMFENKPWVKSSTVADQRSSKVDRVALLYQRFNAAPSIVLDDHSIPKISTYWFKTSIQHDKLPSLKTSLFWRQKRSSWDEFELRFAPPIAGVSSGYGTVGCHVIIDTDDAMVDMGWFGISDSSAEYAREVSRLIKSRIYHPDDVLSLDL